MAQFAKMLPQNAKVMRDGAIARMSAADIVVGDVIVVAIGDKVPADIRVVSCNGLKVDNSSLTGESEPISIGAAPTDDNPLETKNLAFSGSLCVDGEATGVVFKTGDK
jgi:sodium/potassium-transporting ATPase subunit alpha